MPHCYKSSSVRTLGHTGSLLGSTQWKPKGVHSRNQCHRHYHTRWSLLESCYLSSLHQNVPDKGQDPKVSAKGQTSGSCLSTQCLDQQLASSSHLYRSVGHCQWAVCSDKVKQFLSKIVSLRVKTHGISCVLRDYTQNINQGHIFSTHIKVTIQCLTMALLILFGILRIERNLGTHFALQNTQ